MPSRRVRPRHRRRSDWARSLPSLSSSSSTITSSSSSLASSPRPPPHVNSKLPSSSSSSSSGHHRHQHHHHHGVTWSDSESTISCVSTPDVSYDNLLTSISCYASSSNNTCSSSSSSSTSSSSSASSTFTATSACTTSAITNSNSGRIPFSPRFKTSSPYYTSAFPHFNQDSCEKVSGHDLPFSIMRRQQAPISCSSAASSSTAATAAAVTGSNSSGSVTSSNEKVFECVGLPPAPPVIMDMRSVSLSEYTANELPDIAFLFRSMFRLSSSSSSSSSSWSLSATPPPSPASSPSSSPTVSTVTSNTTAAVHSPSVCNSCTCTTTSNPFCSVNTMTERSYRGNNIKTSGVVPSTLAPPPSPPSCVGKTRSAGSMVPYYVALPDTEEGFDDDRPEVDLTLRNKTSGKDEEDYERWLLSVRLEFLFESTMRATKLMLDKLITR